MTHALAPSLQYTAIARYARRSTTCAQCSHVMRWSGTGGHVHTVDVDPPSALLLFSHWARGAGGGQRPDNPNPTAASVDILSATSTMRPLPVQLTKPRAVYNSPGLTHTRRVRGPTRAPVECVTQRRIKVPHGAHPRSPTYDRLCTLNVSVVRYKHGTCAHAQTEGLTHTVPTQIPVIAPPAAACATASPAATAAPIAVPPPGCPKQLLQRAFRCGHDACRPYRYQRPCCGHQPRGRAAARLIRGREAGCATSYGGSCRGGMRRRERRLRVVASCETVRAAAPTCTRPAASHGGGRRRKPCRELQWRAALEK
jgi:hypothetical protein